MVQIVTNLRLCHYDSHATEEEVMRGKQGKGKLLINLCPVVSSCLLFALSTWRLIDAKLSIKTNTTDTKKLRTPKGRIKCSYLHPRLRLNCCLKRKRIRISKV